MFHQPHFFHTKMVFIVCKMKIQILHLHLASAMSVDTKCDSKFCIRIRNFEQLPLF